MVLLGGTVVVSDRNLARRGRVVADGCVVRVGQSAIIDCSTAGIGLIPSTGLVAIVHHGHGVATLMNAAASVIP